MFQFFLKKTPPPKIPVDKIDSDALAIMRRLNREGFEAYLVGGGVRDLLLGIEPKDFDIATNARPRQASRLWRNALVIGKRFKIVLVAFPGRGKQVEIATFRRAPEYAGEDAEARGALYQTDDNEYGTIEDDWRRRDFTANALYYDGAKDQIVDFAGGISDISRKILRCIGDPNIRFREDPVRMMRAVRLSAKLGFTIDKASAKAISAHAAEISLAAKPRLFDEVLKIFAANCAEDALRGAWTTGLLRHLLPGVSAHISDSGGKGSAFWDFPAALDAYQKAHPAAPALKSQNGAALIPFAVLLAPLYLAKHAKSRKRELLARELVAQNLAAPFSTKLFSQPQGLFRNIAFYLGTLPEYRLGARVPQRDREECLAIGRVFWEICAGALGDERVLAAEQDGRDGGALFHSIEAAPGGGADGADGAEDFGPEFKRAKGGEPPLGEFMRIFDAERLEPAMRRACAEGGALAGVLPEPPCALLAALDERRARVDLGMKNWRLILPVALIAAPRFMAESARAEGADSAAHADSAVGALFSALTRDRHTYSTIRKRAAQVLQALRLADIPQAWMADIEIFRAAREICAATFPGYDPPPEQTRKRRARRRRGEHAAAGGGAAEAQTEAGGADAQVATPESAAQEG